MSVLLRTSVINKHDLHVPDFFIYPRKKHLSSMLIVACSFFICVVSLKQMCCQTNAFLMFSGYLDSPSFKPNEIFRLSNFCDLLKGYHGLTSCQKILTASS